VFHRLGLPNSLLAPPSSLDQITAGNPLFVLHFVGLFHQALIFSHIIAAVLGDSLGTGLGGRGLRRQRHGNGDAVISLMWHHFLEPHVLIYAFTLHAEATTITKVSTANRSSAVNPFFNQY